MVSSHCLSSGFSFCYLAWLFIYVLVTVGGAVSLWNFGCCFSFCYFCVVVFGWRFVTTLFVFWVAFGCRFVFRWRLGCGVRWLCSQLCWRHVGRGWLELCVYVRNWLISQVEGCVGFVEAASSRVRFL